MDSTDYSLESSLLEPVFNLNQSATDDICKALWRQRKLLPQGLGCRPISLDSYWTFYRQECENALHDRGRHIALRTHRDVFEVAQSINSGQPRDVVAALCRSKLTSVHENEQEIVDNSIDLVTTLILMSRFGSRPYGFSGQSQIQWTDGSLQETLASYFGDTNKLLTENVKLEKIFNGPNLERIAGIKIMWTDNLVDHLRLADDDCRVHVFHHASFLELQKESHSPLPEGLAEETLRTLALLFPSSGDATTRKWFNHLPITQEVDRRVLQCGRLKTDDLKIDKFKFWRDRLLTLKQVFDESQPKTISQWWHDRRNGVQWYTFWVAVMVLALTVVFGLVQCIEGAIQDYASLKALN